MTVSVQNIAMKLDKLVQEKSSGCEDVVELLQMLEKQPIDLAMLQSTNIGKTVNNLRKDTKNEKVSTICKTLVKNWKNLLKVTTGSELPDTPVASPGSVGPNRKKMKMEEVKKEAVSSPKLATPNGFSRSSSTTSISSSGATATTPTTPVQMKMPVPAPKMASVANGACDTNTNDGTRLKTREMLLKALTKDGVPDGARDASVVAAEIESFIYNEHKSTDTRYKTRIRSRIINLQDSRNPRLHENVLLGHISTERFSNMTSAEMASDEMKDLREKYTKEAINDHQMATTGGTETDLLQCGKCKQRKCTYNQVQTRSADEPMTTFVYCMNCGNRWKFC